jgi:hypothetical protein
VTEFAASAGLFAVVMPVRTRDGKYDIAWRHHANQVNHGAGAARRRAAERQITNCA